MQSYQIFVGFSDIKSELRKRTRIFKDMQEMKLWFSLAHGVLYAHDYHEHSKCIVIAFRTISTDIPSTGTPLVNWSIKLDPKTFGHMLILDVVNSVPEESIIKELNARYYTHGSYI